METTIEDRFQAAVNVIKGLPKNGPYQPSTTMMLKFYGLYKQAVEGPADPRKRPAFWDIIGKAKYDAWNSNKHLSKEQAMQKYVDELKEIIETMSFTENVQNFVGSISGLDNIDLDDLEMIAPGMREIAESHPDSPFNSRTNSPHHGVSANNDRKESNKINGHNYGKVNGDVNGSLDSSDAEKEYNNSSNYGLQTDNTLSHHSNSLVEQSDDEYVDPDDMHNDFTENMMLNTEILKQIQLTVSKLNTDMVVLNQRMSSVEKCVKEMRTNTLSNKKNKKKYPSWWPFEDISPLWFTLLILWPFIMRRIGNILTSSKRVK